MVLSRCADVSIYRQCGKKVLDFFFAHLARVSFVMKEDEAFDPVDVSFLGLVAVMPETEDRTDLIEQFWLVC